MKSKRKWLWTFLFNLFLLPCFLFCPPSPSAAGILPEEEPSESLKMQIREDYARLPLSFIENRGQVDPQVKYYAPGGGSTLFFTEKELVFTFHDPSQVVRLIPLQMSPQVKLQAQKRLPGLVHYFLGNDPSRWQQNLPTYQEVLYEEAYPGIDLCFYGTNRQLEYDVLVKPGADPSQVRFQYEGVKSLTINSEGDLLIRMTDDKELIQKKPVVYQEIEGQRVAREGRFELDPTTSNAFSFLVAAYDPRYPVIIDPVILYSTYLGGSSYDEGLGIAVDRTGNAYVTGMTTSTDFPTKNPLQASKGSDYDAYTAFVAKLNPSGSALVYSTYLGGSVGEYGYAIAVDAAGNAYVTGVTDSMDFPTQNPLQPYKGGADAFVTKIRTVSVPEFFDDFHYTSVDDAHLTSHGWRVVNWLDGPPDGAIYSKENIEFQDDPFLGQRVLVLKADRPTAGEGIDALPVMARLETPPYFREGTFAALVRFDDAPLEFQDTSIQTFYLITPFTSYCGKEEYSEVDFEYLPYNTWWTHAWRRAPYNFYRTLQLASFKTADCAHQNLVYRCDQIPLPGEPQARWSQLLVQIGGGQVKFFLDGVLQSFTAVPPYYPESDMEICLAHWNENLKSQLRWQHVEREYLFRVDWVYFSQNSNLSWAKVQSRVNYLRSKGIARLPKNGLPKYAW